jgi:hypothetical protein
MDRTMNERNSSDGLGLDAAVLAKYCRRMAAMRLLGLRRRRRGNDRRESAHRRAA